MSIFSHLLLRPVTKLLARRMSDRLFHYQRGSQSTEKISKGTFAHAFELIELLHTNEIDPLTMSGEHPYVQGNGAIFTFSGELTDNVRGNQMLEFVNYLLILAFLQIESMPSRATDEHWEAVQRLRKYFLQLSMHESGTTTLPVEMPHPEPDTHGRVPRAPRPSAVAR